MPTAPDMHFADALVNWYESHARSLPWRLTTDPYPIWLAEIMLQQTTVVTVIPYYQRFLAEFPTLETLAQAPEEAVLRLWQGLGYYSRARNLHRCAQTLCHTHHGQFPEDEATLLTLPGIGPYTAAAISAFAFNHTTNVVDGNVERVISRLFAEKTPLPAARPKLRQAAASLLPQRPIGRVYGNAIMELGATVCTPKNPLCDSCPVRPFCKAQREGDVTRYPLKEKKKKVPEKQGTAWLVKDPFGRVYLQKRTTQKLLHNLWEPFHQGWEEHEDEPPFYPHDPQRFLGQTKHVFSHFKLTLDVYEVVTRKPANQWFEKGHLPPIPTVFQKVFALDGKEQNT